MKRKLLSILLTLCMVVGLFPMSAFAATPTFSDTNGHWAESAIETWAVYDVLKGSDGQFRPNDPITRAELAAVLSRVIGYTAVTNTAFSDVPSDAWYYSDIAKLYAAGIMQGDGNGVMHPDDDITREEAVVLIARAFNVEENAGNENPFPDTGDISGWASFLVDGMKAAGYISGDPAGNFNPKASITRAEVVTVLANMIDDFHYQPGEVDDEARSFTPKNAVIRTSDVTLKNYILTGNLWITEGVADGDVTLENVSVSGTTYIRGGGSNSIDVTGGSLGVVIVDALTNPHLNLSKETEVERIYLNGTSSVTHGTATVSYDAESGTMTFGGTIDQLTLNADGTATATIGGIVYDIIPEVREGSPKTTFKLAADAVVKNMVVNAPVDITGEGKIEKMEVHSDGVVIDKSVNVKPENIKVDEGVKITVGDKEYTGTGGTLPKENTNTGGGGSYTPSPSVQSVSITPNSVTTPVGTAITDEQLVATVTVTGGAAQAVTWSIESEGTTGSGKVTVTTDGKLSVAADAAVGTATIRATSTVDASKYGECSVIVWAYTVTYDVNGGSSAPPTDSVAYVPVNNTVTVTNDTPIYVTKIFAGWNTDANGKGMFYAAGATFTITADTTLYAMWSGDGSAGNPKLITTQVELAAINTDNASRAGNYLLVADIALAGDWTPIGRDSNSTAFTGSFDGNGHTISGLTMERDGTGEEGLFGWVNSTGIAIQNLCVEIADTGVTGFDAGGIAGYLQAGTIQNCVVQGGFVYGTNTGGGIVGLPSGGTVQNCYVSSEIRSDGPAGGISGTTSNAGATIKNCYATGAVSGNYAGGIVGRGYDGSITGCVALNQSVSGTTNAGRVVGLVGSASVTDCLAESSFSVTGTGGNNGTLKLAAELEAQTAYTGIGWLFGTNNDNPWVWDSVNNIPILYWQVRQP